MSNKLLSLKKTQGQGHTDNKLTNSISLMLQAFSCLPSHSIRGHSNMEVCETRDDHVLLSGWATAAEGFPPLSHIAVVNAAKNEGIGYAEINVERPDVQAVLPFAPLVSGYRFTLPYASCCPDPVNDLLLYGVTNDFSHYMDIPGLGGMLPLPPFYNPRQNLEQNLLPYLTTKQLSWADITATHRCNIDCRYCCLRGRHTSTDDTPLETLIQYIDTSDDFAVGYWQMSNLGEITIYPRWLELVENIRKKSPFTILSNFCKRFSDEELMMLARAKYLTISLDTTDRTLLKSIRTGADPVRIVKNIEAVRAAAAKAGLASPHINLSTVVSRPVVPYLPSLALLAVVLNVNHVLLQDVSPEDAVSGMADDLILSPNVFSQAEAIILKDNMKNMLDILKQNDISVTLMASLRRFASKEDNLKNIDTVQPDLSTKKKTKLCLAPWFRVYIGINGNVNPCAHIASVGKISKQTSLKTVVNGLRMQSIRRGLLTGEFENCCATCRFGFPCTVKELIGRIEYYRNEGNLDKITFGLFE